jgi:hypothetical protein
MDKRRGTLALGAVAMKGGGAFSLPGPLGIILLDPHQLERDIAAIGDSHLRDKIVRIALSQQGLVSAKESAGVDPTNNSRLLRKGWERLVEYFDVASPETPRDRTVIKYLPTGKRLGKNKAGERIDLDDIPAWCGIFALWAIKKACLVGWSLAGMTPKVGVWRGGSGISSVSGFKGVHDKDKVKRGDVGYIAKNQHHFIVVRVDGDALETIEGNTAEDGSATGGKILDHKSRRKKSTTDGFYTVFESAGGRN